MSKRSDRKLNELFKAHGYDPQGKELIDSENQSPTKVIPGKASVYNTGKLISCIHIPAIVHDSIQLCTDNSGILEDIKDCMEVINSLKELALIICPMEFNQWENSINDYFEVIQKIKDKIQIDTYKLAIKKITTSISFEVHYGCLKIKEKTGLTQIRFNNLKELIKSNNINLKFGSIGATEEDINKVKVDLKDVLKDLSLFFPELKIDLPKNKIVLTETRLFTSSNLTKTSTSLVADTFFNICVSKSVSFNKISEKLRISRKSYSNGDIDIIQEAREAILDNYGEDTFKVFIALVAYWYEKGTEETITVSGSDILDYLNKKYERNNQGKRVKKVNNLQWLAHQCELIDSLRVYSSSISPRNGNKFNIDRTPLIEFPRISYAPHQIDIYGEIDFSTITDLEIKFKVGDWFNFFNDSKYCVQFGFTHKKALSSSGILSNFLHWVTIKSRQNQKGDFKIQTVLEGIGLKKEVEDILTTKGSGYKALNLFRDFNSMIKEAQSISDLPQIITYDPPQWQGRKPNGWFKQWLKQTINIKEARFIEAQRSISSDKVSLNTSNTSKKEPSPLTVQDLKNLLEEYKDNPNISLRKLANLYGISQPTLSRKIKNNKLTKKEIQELTNLILFLAQKRT